jgi:prepilin-type N-terminal cleavage/methylation domain-containing protein
MKIIAKMEKDMSQYRKAFTIIELMIGMAIVTILVSGVMFAFKPFTKQYFMTQENISGEIFQLSYDIQKNKIYSKRFLVSEDGTTLKLFRSPTCYASYFFLEDDSMILKTITCTNGERLEIDNTFKIPNIKTVNFEENGKNIKLEIKTQIKNYSYNFEF